MRIEDFKRPPNGDNGDDDEDFNREASEAAASAGMAQASSADRVQKWKADAALWFEMRRHGEVICADDLTRAIGLPDRGANKNNVLGAVFSAAARRGLIVWTGQMRKSERVDRHVGVHRIWRVL